MAGLRGGRPVRAVWNVVFIALTAAIARLYCVLQELLRIASRKRLKQTLDISARTDMQASVGLCRAAGSSAV